MVAAKPEASAKPGQVYVTHPYVIAVLVPGDVDSGISKDLTPENSADKSVKTPELHFDPVK